MITLNEMIERYKEYYRDHIAFKNFGASDYARGINNGHLQELQFVFKVVYGLTNRDIERIHTEVLKEG